MKRENFYTIEMIFKGKKAEQNMKHKQQVRRTNGEMVITNYWISWEDLTPQTP